MMLPSCRRLRWAAVGRVFAQHAGSSHRREGAVVMSQRRPKYAAATATMVASGFAGVGLMQRNYGANGDGPLPAGARVIVVGAGIVGTATARELARIGYSVRLVDERRGPGEGCSQGNAGTLNISTTSRRLSTPPFFWEAPTWLMRAPTAEGPLEHNKFTHRSTFLDPGFWLWGISYLRMFWSHESDGVFFNKDSLRRSADEREALALAATDEGIDAFVVKGRLVVNCGVAAAGSYTASAAGPQRMPAEKCLEHEPCFREAVERGLISEGYWYEVDGHGDCRSYLRKLVKASQSRYDLQLRFGVACSRLLVSAGTCRGVELCDGEQMMADAVVLANGSGVARLAATAGVYVPIQALRGYSITVPVRNNATAPVPKGSSMTEPHQLYVTRISDAELGDSVRFAAFGELAANWIEEPTPALLDRLEELVRHVVPRVEEMVDWGRRRAWVGARPLSPDSNPIVGPTHVQGLYVNTGHSFNGWRFGTLTGLLCANGLSRGWEANGRYDVLYSPQRFLPWRQPLTHCHAHLPLLREIMMPTAAE